jgi:hypothetical protein
VPISVQVALAVIGSLAGIAYAGLGIAALRHLPSADSTDRVFGWSLWWFAESSRYTAEGKALCRKGAIAFAVALASWLAWFAVHRL